MIQAAREIEGGTSANLYHSGTTLATQCIQQTTQVVQEADTKDTCITFFISYMLATSVFSIPILLPINPPTILDLGSRSLGPGATCQLPTRPCIF